MRERQPTIGNLYTLEEQCGFHGGAWVQRAPMKDGKVLLLRTPLELNPDAPLMMDWRKKNSDKTQAMSEQGGIPFYIQRQANGWEYMGKFEVRYATTNPTVRAWRNLVTGDEINEVLFLEER